MQWKHLPWQIGSDGSSTSFATSIDTRRSEESMWKITFSFMLLATREQAGMCAMTYLVEPQQHARANEEGTKTMKKIQHLISLDRDKFRSV